MVQFKQSSTPKDGYYEIVMGNECKTLHSFFMSIEIEGCLFLRLKSCFMIFLRNNFALNYYFYIFGLF